MRRLLPRRGEGGSCQQAEAWPEGGLEEAGGPARPLRGAGEDPELPGAGDRLAAVADVELAVQGLQVGLHRRRGDEELLGDLLVAQALAAAARGRPARGSGQRLDERAGSVARAPPRQTERLSRPAPRRRRRRGCARRARLAATSWGSRSSSDGIGAPRSTKGRTKPPGAASSSASLSFSSAADSSSSAACANARRLSAWMRSGTLWAAARMPEQAIQQLRGRLPLLGPRVGQPGPWPASAGGRRTCRGLWKGSGEAVCAQRRACAVRPRRRSNSASKARTSCEEPRVAGLLTLLGDRLDDLPRLLASALLNRTSARAKAA